MKNRIKVFSYLIILLAALNGCKKNNTGDDDGSPSSGGSGGTSSSNAYQPLTSGSTWTYTNYTAPQNINMPSPSTTTLTGGTAVFDGKTYYTFSNMSNFYPDTQIGYIRAANHLYFTRATNFYVVSGVTVEFNYLNDQLPAGSTWTTNVTGDGTINGLPAKTVNTIVEVNISKVVLGTTYNNVIHSKVDLQYNYGMGFTSTAVYDYYVAKNIGIVELDSKLDVSGYSSSTLSYLSSYSIK